MYQYFLLHQYFMNHQKVMPISNSMDFVEDDTEFK